MLLINKIKWIILHNLSLVQNTRNTGGKSAKKLSAMHFACDNTGEVMERAVVPDCRYFWPTCSPCVNHKPPFSHLHSLSGHLNPCMPFANDSEHLLAHFMHQNVQFYRFKATFFVYYCVILFGKNVCHDRQKRLRAPAHQPLSEESWCLQNML